MSTKVVTGKVRFSYAQLFEPKQINNQGDPKYSVTLLIPKSDTATLAAIKSAIQEARDKYCEKFGKNALPEKPVTTLYDGDGFKKNGDPFGPECAGCYVISVNSKTKPVVVDAFRQPIDNPEEVYSGCYGRAAVNFFGYSNTGNKGISAGLQSVQKLSDGDRLGGSVGSADDFDDGFTDDSFDDIFG